MIYGHNYILLTILDVIVTNNKFHRSQFIFRPQIKFFMNHKFIKLIVTYYLLITNHKFYKLQLISWSQNIKLIDHKLYLGYDLSYYWSQINKFLGHTLFIDHNLYILLVTYCLLVTHNQFIGHNQQNHL